MKKFLSIVLMILLVVSPVMVVEAKSTTTKRPTTTASAKKTTKKSTKKTTTKKTTTEETKEKKNPINIYVFHSSSCPHCADLRSFLDELKEDKTYGSMFKVVEYEVTSSLENSDLMYEVVNHFKQKYDGVPIYVIGNQYMSGFSKDTYGDQVKDAIKKAYDEQPTDEVAKLIEEFNNKKDSNITGYIVLAVVAVIIVGVIYSSSKNKYYDDEVDSEEVTEEKPVEEPKEKKESTKEATKKTETKKTSSTTKKKTTKKKTTKKKA